MPAPDLASRPNTIPWPPLLLCGAAALAWLLGGLFPLPLPGGRLPRLFGYLVACTGLALDLAAMAALHRHRANILPHRAATALVTSFPYTRSRNPIYLGNTLLLAGFAFIAADAWFLLAAAAMAQAVAMLAIRREEAHLAAKFGPAWAAYAARTPRWLGPI